MLTGLTSTPARRRNSGYYHLGVLNGDTPSVAKGINNHGVIVGQSSTHAFVVGLVGPPGAAIAPLVDLNTMTYQYAYGQWELVGYRSGGWSLLSAERVSSTGSIAGYGLKNGVTRAFVLVPR